MGAEIVRFLADKGAIGVLAVIGIALGYSAEEWPPEFTPVVASLGIFAVSLSIIWLTLIFVYKLTGWSRLQYLEEDIQKY